MGFRTWLRDLNHEIGTNAQPTLRELHFVLVRMRRNPLSLSGTVILIFLGLIALLAPVLAPPTPGVDPYIMPYEGFRLNVWGIMPSPTPPSPKHPFGTLNGFDLYYGCIWGTRTAFRVGLLVIFGGLLIGLFFGCIAGYYGGIIDTLLMRFADIFFAFPSILLVIVLIVALPSVLPINLGLVTFTLFFSSLDKIMVTLVLVRWPFYARMIRGEIMKVKNEDYVEAAKAVGCSSARVMVKHILPNSIYPILIMAFLDVGGVVLAASTLSFLGFGPGMGYAEWGSIISMSQNSIFATPQDPFKYAYTFLYPGLFISVFILAWSMLGDSLRDIMDPMIRRR